MKYTIHIHKMDSSTGKRTHYGYLAFRDKVLSHNAIRVLRSMGADNGTALVFHDWDSAVRYVNEDYFKQFSEFKGNILIEPLPTEIGEDEEANNYLKFCHKYNVNFI